MNAGEELIIVYSKSDVIAYLALPELINSLTPRKSPMMVFTKIKTCQF
jgi:hypothetical protein